MGEREFCVVFVKTVILELLHESQVNSVIIVPNHFSHRRECSSYPACSKLKKKRDNLKGAFDHQNFSYYILHIA